MRCTSGYWRYEREREAGFLALICGQQRRKTSPRRQSAVSRVGSINSIFLVQFRGWYAGHRSAWQALITTLDSKVRRTVLRGQGGTARNERVRDDQSTCHVSQSSRSGRLGRFDVIPASFKAVYPACQWSFSVFCNFLVASTLAFDLWHSSSTGRGLFRLPDM